MITVDLGQQALDPQASIGLARRGPVLLLASDGSEFCLAEADDFEREAEMLRNSVAFQGFLDQRSKATGRISLEAIETELEQDAA